ncbi:hypothetical protein JO972_14805 [Verrucomicrobiaceae bacterium 5K15]|uniref:Uncharacterized protein n=1 Tax=Oceaniferula flava TaxID=2800421 RepID=A0AAE2SF55_9BACT|nr:hypothetical protein [Oceaniferula flavus]MBK1856237.1 hypothetical protein [Oceaniferula flavus]MBM1137544.1 hypothetical protein [Oceaniferula flavus]
MKFKLLVAFAALTSSGFADSAPPKQISGIYPHLAMFNNENECGTGAIVPWADRLWVITYAPHAPRGSSDKLYEITPDLKQIVRPESVGGTPANRMIHKESNQLFIGPYIIDADRQVRAIPHTAMFGRLTGNARHLTKPAEKMVYATMEEGIYEVDVQSLEVKELWADEQRKTKKRKANLPGYHGKGFYSGQGVYIYSNNGEHGKAAKTRPDVPSGVLAEWDGKAKAWTIVRRNQFTEITGPGGIHGSANPATDPIWAVGWDYRSLMLGVRMPEKGWTFYRLPKGSHSYDGAHGWNTEWPRIRDIGEDDYLMTMHGTFWKFPKTFTPDNSSGIAPRSNYLKVIGDFTRWNDHIVMGCDDTAKAEFLNKRKAKGEIAAPQSQSNLWFVTPDQLDHFGPVIGRGAVWEKEAVQAKQPSDPYLFSGYDIRGLHLSHEADQAVTFTLEVDQQGDGNWTPLKQIEVAAKGYVFTAFTAEESGTWVRITSNIDLPKATAAFTYRNEDSRSDKADAMFNGLATSDQLTGGLVRARDKNKRTLSFAAVDAQGKDIGYYEMADDLTLKRTDDQAAHSHTKQHTAIPSAALSTDAASVIYTDEQGKRWRLPKAELTGSHPLGSARIAREVATERDLLNAHGTFYELPARNAGGISKLRAIATHNRYIHDFCSYRGLLIMSGIAQDQTGQTYLSDQNKHTITSDDGKTALWAGAIDDIWKLGKPHGKGGPWKDAEVKAGKPSDPYLMTGYDHKSLAISASEKCSITAQVDLTGTGHWVNYRTFTVDDIDQEVTHEFPKEFQAYWIRFVSDRDASVTTQLIYR